MQARGDKALKPWRDAEGGKREEAEDARNKDASLRSSARLYAFTVTARWDRRAADRASRAIECVLREDAESDWTQDDVRDLVDEDLEEWEA